MRVALTCRCPRCGKGRLFRGFLEVRDACEVCGLDLRAHDAGDGPAFVIICVLSLLVVPLAFILDVVAEPSYWVHLALWPPVVLGLALGLLRPAKAFFVAQQFHHRVTVLRGSP